jgi:phage terminase Nu1 subunit (DNA packaging protein)
LQKAERSRLVLNDDDTIIMSTALLAKTLGVTPQTVAQWHKAGMPKEKTGWWNLSTVLAWRGTTNGITDISDEARKLKADADYREAKASKEAMDLAFRRGELISKEEVDRQWSQVGNQLKSNMLLWSRTMAPELAHLDMRSVEKVLTDAVYDLLEQLSSTSRYQKKKAIRGDRRSSICPD